MVRKIEVKKGDLSINETVEVVYEKVITAFGNSAKIDAPKKYIGKRAYVIIIKE
jgi:putative transposon-encoded protein